MQVSRIARGKDWTADQHKGCDAMEEAADRLMRASPQEMEAAAAALAGARQAFGAALLAQDRARSPSTHVPSAKRD